MMSNLSGPNDYLVHIYRRTSQSLGNMEWCFYFCCRFYLLRQKQNKNKRKHWGTLKTNCCRLISWFYYAISLLIVYGFSSVFYVLYSVLITFVIGQFGSTTNIKNQPTSFSGARVFFLLTREASAFIYLLPFFYSYDIPVVAWIDTSKCMSSMSQIFWFFKALICVCGCGYSFRNSASR